jgi:hypothetical protein
MAAAVFELHRAAGGVDADDAGIQLHVDAVLTVELRRAERDPVSGALPAR